MTGMLTETPTKLISIITPCFNERDNVALLFQKVKALFEQLEGYEFEHIFADNHSTDGTTDELKTLAAQDPRVKVIINSRNFGALRSAHNALLAAKGHAAVIMAADLQDPPESIASFIQKWEEGNKIVLGVKTKYHGNPLVTMFRKLYYFLIERIGEIEHISHFTGFGLYDRIVLDSFKEMKDVVPYFRGMVAEVGFARCKVPFTQKPRHKGKTKTNFYVLYEMAMLGFVNYSKVPLRLATFLGFILAFLSLSYALISLFLILLFGKEAAPGISTLIIAIFLFSGVQLFFTGILGEYIGAIYTQVKSRPYVFEEERINFDD